MAGLIIIPHQAGATYMVYTSKKLIEVWVGLETPRNIQEFEWICWQFLHALKKKSADTSRQTHPQYHGKD